MPTYEITLNDRDAERLEIAAKGANFTPEEQIVGMVQAGCARLEKQSNERIKKLDALGRL